MSADSEIAAFNLGLAIEAHRATAQIARRLRQLGAGALFPLATSAADAADQTLAFSCQCLAKARELGCDAQILVEADRLIAESIR